MALNFASLAILFQLEGRFMALTGTQVFDTHPARAELAIVFKRLKLVSLASTASVTWALVFFVVGLWAWRRFAARRDG